tara:strand:- start:197 stop:586 length:390 start_codon:yes stop_codon:yes gene_type:complete
MGHWARIDSNNIVQEVIVIKEAELDTGNWGDKSKWVKTSYNTRDGKHYVPKEHQDYSEESPDQSKALRFRYAGIGDIYDATNDVFYSQQPFASWTLNKTTWSWEAPVAYPKDDKMYNWDENKKEWVEFV